MSNRPFVAARIELWLDRRLEKFFRGRGWRERVITYSGYGSEDGARVLARIVLAPQFRDSQIGKAAEQFLHRRGWRNFLTAACVHQRYSIRFGDAVVEGTTDRGGYVDHRLRGHGQSPGWQQATILPEGVDEGEQADVLVVKNDETFGIISDIDDTVLTTLLPRPMVAAWNSFIVTESARQAVPGMAALYRELLAAHPDAPIIFLSTGAWNTQPFLRRFLKRHNFPDGPMLLTDWGPTNTGWFRSGQAHKRESLLQLCLDLPNITWLLVGDDGQHDPEIYGDFARNDAPRARLIAIRQLNPTEQFLAHGTTEPIAPDDPHERADVETISAPDGRGLLAQLRQRGLLTR
ncbi:App1 family protein [Nigerium massiliense]|uniref:App1 family protein n=1 Tax=Nigerium massiliense TaxID=1522317 RepID=UPI00058EFC3C|nr:phosphatase domain-containing protein [Nigerium massiliense]